MIIILTVRCDIYEQDSFHSQKSVTVDTTQATHLAYKVSILMSKRYIICAFSSLI